MLKLLSSIKHSPKTQFIRKYTNLMYYDENKVSLDLGIINTVEVDGYRWYMTDQINSLQRIKGNPWFSNTRMSDIAVDIGANIGAITIPLASMVKEVWSVEPIFFEELRLNSDLNKRSNIHILKYGIGKESKKERFSFSGRTTYMPVISFSQLKNWVGGHIDFLKMDGEGCEWEINPNELKGIRELRIEFHIRRGREKECKAKFQNYIDFLGSEGYKYEVAHPKYGPDPYDKEDYMVKASLEVL